jgi:hypothetical protein
MNTPVEFRKYAAACEIMAKLTKDPQSKAVWKGIAERWLLCAKLEEQEAIVLRRRLAKKSRRARSDPRYHFA